MTKTWLRVSAIVYLMFGAVSAAQAGAENIFKYVSPSVVLIRDFESHGSGVVLDNKGRILTNYHVVNTPLPLEVTAEVMQGSRRVSMTFSEVTVEKVHKDYDLATINVKLPAGVYLDSIETTSRTPEPGEDCYVIGNPGGVSGEALRNTITAGIISAEQREIEGLSYIQTTAAINPGDSGGALVDKYGKLVGIITFVISDTEGIGFAIPFKILREYDFVEAKDRKGDFEKGQEYTRIGQHWYNQVPHLSGEEKEFALSISFIAYRLSLSEWPNDPAPYSNLGNVYVQMEEYKTAKYYYERAFELSSTPDPSNLLMLGVCENALGNKEKAHDLWKQGLFCKTDDDFRGECAEHLSISAFNEKNYLEAAYLIKWANHIAKARPHRSATRSRIYQESVNELSEKEYKFILDKNSDFSFEELERLRQGHIPQTASEGRPSLVDSSRTKAATSSEPPFAMEKGLFEKVLANAPDPGTSGLRKKMPEKVADCRSAYGGIYLVMKFPVMKRLAVFNIVQGTFEKYFPISTSDVIYACGGNTMVVYDPSQKQFHLYNMATLTRTATKTTRLEGVLTDIEMGIMESDKAVVSWADGIEDGDTRHYGLMEIPEMRITEFKTEKPTRGNGFEADSSDYRNNVHIRLNPQMKRFLAWGSFSGFTYGTIDGTMVWSTYKHGSYGSLSFLADQSRIVSSYGKILDTEGEIRHDFTDRVHMLFAVDGANMVIKISGKEATLVDAINLTELQTFTLPFELKPYSWRRDTDRLVYASSRLNRAAFIDNSDPQILVFKLTGEAGVADLADQLTGVKAGTIWTYKLNYPAGTEVMVEDAPEGVTFNPATLTLSWQIPRTQEPGSQQILISVVEPEKEEVFQRITITIQ